MHIGLAGAHGLRYGAFTTRSCGGEFPKLRRLLTEASQIEGMRACFMWSQNQDVGCNRGPLFMKRTRAAESKGETNAKAWLSMPGASANPWEIGGDQNAQPLLRPMTSLASPVQHCPHESGSGSQRAPQHRQIPYPSHAALEGSPALRVAGGVHQRSLHLASWLWWG